MPEWGPANPADRTGIYAVESPTKKNIYLTTVSSSTGGGLYGNVNPAMEKEDDTDDDASRGRVNPACAAYEINPEAPC